MKELIISLLLFIGAETNYNTDLPHPTILFLPQDQLESKYNADAGTDNTNDLWGFYDLKKNEINLRDTWNIHDPFDKSVLLHELIHYVQDLNEVKFDCVQQMEAEAWPLQKKYLLQYHGVDWEYDTLWFFFVSTCGPEGVFNY
jgi:hypothetical protein